MKFSEELSKILYNGKVSRAETRYCSLKTAMYREAEKGNTSYEVSISDPFEVAVLQRLAAEDGLMFLFTERKSIVFAWKEIGYEE